LDAAFLRPLAAKGTSSMGGAQRSFLLAPATGKGGLARGLEL